jgi:hypothetical protein
VKFAISVVRSLDGSGEEVWNPKRLWKYGDDDESNHFFIFHRERRLETRKKKEETALGHKGWANSMWRENNGGWAGD